MYATVIATIALLSTAAAFAPAGRMTRSTYVICNMLMMVLLCCDMSYFNTVLCVSSYVFFFHIWCSVKMALGPAAAQLVGSDIEYGTVSVLFSVLFLFEWKSNCMFVCEYGVGMLDMQKNINISSCIVFFYRYLPTRFYFIIWISCYHETDSEPLN